jgi:hypothetical protein
MFLKIAGTLNKETIKGAKIQFVHELQQETEQPHLHGQ